VLKVFLSIKCAKSADTGRAPLSRFAPEIKLLGRHWPGALFNLHLAQCGVRQPGAVLPRLQVSGLANPLVNVLSVAHS